MHKLTISQKQIGIYLALIIIAVVASVISYHATQQKWLLFRKAEQQFTAKNFQEAIGLYQQSLYEGFTTVNLYVHLADSYTVVGDFSEAIQYYRKYLEVHPEDRFVRLLLARVLNWDGRLGESKEEYRKLLENSQKKDEK